MKVLMVGCDRGSWQMRGRQLGYALGARCTTDPKRADWAWADVVVLVKRAAFQFGQAAKASGAPLVWDVLDFWKQPEDNGKPLEQLLDVVHRTKDELRIRLLIGATRAMAEDIGGVYLSHHSWIGMVPRPVKPMLEVVAYEGQAKYLGSWRVALERACARRGLVFVVNPSELSEADVVVAFRGEKWDGEACRRWKSGVKYVNAIAAHRPVLTQPTAAAAEIQPHCMAFDHPSELDTALQIFASAGFRRDVAAACAARAKQFTVQAIAMEYSTLLYRVAEGRAA